MAAVRQHINADTALLDWLTAFASSIEWDEITGEWTVRTTQPDYPPGVGRALRAAAGRAMRAAMAADAASGAARFALSAR